MGIDQFEYLERDSSWELDLSSTTTGLIGIVNTQQSIGWTTKGSHWVAYVVDLPSKYQNLRVTVFDSLAPTSKETMRRIATVAEALAKASVTAQRKAATSHPPQRTLEPPSPYKNVKVQQVDQANGPHQTDGFNCGIFALAYLLHVARTNQLHMHPTTRINFDEIREKVACSILVQRRVFGNAEDE